MADPFPDRRYSILAHHECDWHSGTRGCRHSVPGVRPLEQLTVGTLHEFLFGRERDAGRRHFLHSPSALPTRGLAIQAGTPGTEWVLDLAVDQSGGPAFFRCSSALADGSVSCDDSASLLPW